MGFFKASCITCLALTINLFGMQEVDKRQILYLMQVGEISGSFSQYQKCSEKDKIYDFDTLQKMAHILLEKGAESTDATSTLLATFGAGLSASCSSMPILQRGLFSPDLQTQLVALHFISLLQDESKERLLLEALNSPFLPTRLEAIYQMAISKDYRASGQISSLMHKLPPYFKPLFPELYALLGNKDAIRNLKELLNDADHLVRVEAIYSSARFKREELLPQIRQKLTGGTLSEKEAAAFALSTFHDTFQLKILKKLASSQICDHLQLTAAKALVSLGEISYKKILEDFAKKGNLFAITSLKDVEGSNSLLASFLRSSDLNIRFNAAIALLKLKDRRCIPALKELFVQDSRGLALQPFFSPGKGLMFWRIIPSAMQHLKDPTFDIALSLNIKEELLKDALELAEEDFLFLATLLFEEKEHELIPMLTHLLENLQSEKAIELLKKNAEKVGAPLIRAWCNLALYRLKEEGPYEKFVKKWIASQKKSPLIQLRPFIPWEARTNGGEYHLSAEETSRLLIEMYSAIAASKTDLPLLLEAMQSGNPKNNFALAGLLIRGAE